MAIDIRSERLVPLGEARRDFIPRKRGNQIAPSTLWRWIHRGLVAADGTVVRLEILYAGGEPMTSQQAIQRFFDELTHRNQAAGPRPDTESPPLRSAATERRLRRSKLL